MRKMENSEVDGVVSVIAGREIGAPLPKRRQVQAGGNDFDGVAAFSQDLTLRVDD
jgi:hypothetical protein